MKKKWFSIILCFLFTVICAVPASANSGPIRFEHAPAYGIVPVKDCPITVENEDLTFQAIEQYAWYSNISAKVTAAYRMKNPTANAMNVQMAFPIICDFNQLTANGGIKITADGKELPFTISITNQTPNFGVKNQLYDASGKLNTSYLPDFSTMLENAIPLTNSSKYITDQRAAYYQVKNINKGYLKAEITAPQKKTGIFSLCHQPAVRSGDQVTVSEYVADELDVFSFMAFGEKPEIKLSAYEDFACTKKLSTEPQLTITQASPKELCTQRLTDYYKIKEPVLQSIACGYLDNTLAQTGFCDVMQIDKICNIQCIYLLNYAVPFAANSEQNVSVSYTTVPSMQEKSGVPTSTFAYLSNPAKNWASFKNLNVVVIPPSKDYVISSSTIDLKADSNGAYKASLTALPQDDIAFVLRTKEPFPWRLLTAGIVLILLILLILIVIWLYRKKRHKTNA